MATEDILRVVFDTNAFQAYFERGDRRRPELEKFLTSGYLERIILPSIVVYEIYILLAELHEERAFDVLGGMLQAFERLAPVEIVGLEVERKMLQSFYKFRKKGLRLPDAVIAAITDVRNGMLVTADKEFEDAGVKVHLLP